MKRTVNWTTKGLGFFLQLAAATFILALMVFTISGLAPVTETRIADCTGRIETLQGDLDYAQNQGASEEELRQIERNISMYQNRIHMLENREKYYSVSMAFLVGVLLLSTLLQHIRIAVPRQKKSGESTRELLPYSPLLSAPVSALCVLLAIGVTYRTIFSLTLFDVATLIGAVAVSFISFLVYRHGGALYLEGKSRRDRRLARGDLLFLLLAAGILLLLLVTLLFGVTVNGAKLWIVVLGVQLQPGEFIKVLLMLLFSASYGKQWRALTAFGVAAVTILFQLVLRDMGTAIVIFSMLLIMLLLLLDNKKTFPLFGQWFDRQLNSRKLLVLVLFASVAAFAVVLCIFPYARERFAHVGTALENAYATNGIDSSQQASMLRALAFGGIGGLGLENSSQIINIFAADSDMAIAGISAVFGAGMLLIVVLCYAVLIVLPMRKHAVYRQHYFLTAQVAVVLFVQVMLNALGAVDVLPFTGIVAPFLSDGGSALTSFCAMIGLVLATLYPTIKPLEVSDL